MKIASSTSMGRVAYSHDLRITYTDNVNTYLSHNNVILIDELKGKTIDEYIDMLLQPSIDEYNAKQKRKDRKINMTYSEWHKLNDNKGEMVYEFVMQYGEHKDLGSMYYDGSEKDQQKLREEFIEVYTKWSKDWQEQHPNQKILWATIHFDENGGTPHMHIAVCPLSRDFKRGPQCQISMSKSLESDGFKRIETKKEGYQLERAFQQFRKTQERDLIELGYEIKERKGGQHLDCPTYKELMKEADQRIEKAKTLEVFSDKVKEIEERQQEIVIGKAKKDMIVKTTPAKWGKEEMVTITADDFHSLQAVAEITATKKLIEDTKKEIEKEHKRISSKLELGADETLRKENDDLKEIIREKQTQINSMEKTILNQKITIENQKLAIKQLIRLIQDTIPRLLEKAKEILNDIFNKDQEKERSLCQ